MGSAKGKTPERGASNSSLAGSCEAHAVGKDAREPDVKEQCPVQEQPAGAQEDGEAVVTFLARCVAQHEGSVEVVGIEAHLRCQDDFEDDDEVEEEAKLP